MRKKTMFKHFAFTVFAALTLAALFVCGERPAVSQSGGYTVIDLGTLPGTNVSYPEALTNPVDKSKVEVVGTTVSGGLKYHAFYWSAGKMWDIGVLGTGTYSVASAINSLGEVVGHSSTSGIAYSHAFYWSKSRGERNPLDLGALSGGTSGANSINDAGQIVGDSYVVVTLPDGSQRTYKRPVLWEKDANANYTLTELPLLPGHDIG
jgi:probable HAF family extracellular repeat protein